MELKNIVLITIMGLYLVWGFVGIAYVTKKLALVTSQIILVIMLVMVYCVFYLLIAYYIGRQIKL